MKTVFVIGAGASNEVNLPVGSELKHVIADPLRSESKGGAERIYDAFRAVTSPHYSNPFTWEQLYAACEHIRRAMPQAPSIDQFLESHRDDRAIVFCGKLAITHSILEAESKSLLYVEPSTNSLLPFNGKIETTWFVRFMQLLIAGYSKTDLKQRFSSIALIVFNYDRCIEHFIYHYLRSYYDIDPTEAADIVKTIEIYHPYGSVGSLPFLGKEHPVQFGEIPHGSTLPTLAAQIRIFTEVTDKDSSDIVAIRQHMKTALRLVFLGFAFQEKNMELLEPEQYIRDRQVFATCQGISSSRVTKISHRFGPKDPLGHRVIHMGDCGLNFRDMKCSQLVSDFSHDFLLIQ